MQQEFRRSQAQCGKRFICETLDRRLLLSVSAANLPVTTPTGSAVTVPTSAVLGAATGSDHVIGYGSAANGSVSNTSAGVTYTPGSGFTGTDSFSYTVGATDQAVLSLPVGAGSSSVRVSLDTYVFSDEPAESTPGSLQFTADLSGITPVFNQFADTGNKISSGVTLTIDQAGVAGLVYTFTNFLMNDPKGSTPLVTGDVNSPTVDSIDASFSSVAVSASTLTLPTTPSGPAYSLQFADPSTSVSYTLPVNSEFIGLQRQSGSNGKGMFDNLDVTDTGTGAAALDLLSLANTGSAIPLLTLTNDTTGDAVAAQYYFQLGKVNIFSTTSNGSSIPSDDIQISFVSLTESIPVAGGSNSIGRFNEVTQSQSASVTTPLPPSGSLNATASTATASTPEVATPTGPSNSSLAIGSLVANAISIQDSSIVDVTLPLGGDTPAWLVGAGTGNTYSSITLTQKRITGPATGQFIYLACTLQNAVVSSYFIRENLGGAETLELLLQAKSVTESYTPLNSGGTAGTPVVRTYNFSSGLSSTGGGFPSDTAAPAANTAILTFPLVSGQTAPEQLVVTDYSFGLDIDNGAVGTEGLDITVPLSSESPLLLQQASSGIGFSGNVTLTVYTSSSTTPLVTYTFGTVSVTADSVDLTPTITAPFELTSLKFQSLQTAYGLPATNASAAPNAQLVSYYLAGSTTPVTFAVNDSQDSGAVGLSGLSLNPFSLSFNLTAAESALDTQFASMNAIPVIILTQYDATGSAAITYTLQNSVVQFIAPAGGGGAIPTDTVTFMYTALTIDYLPASVATYNVPNKNTTAPITTPPAPSGSPLAGGSTPGVSNASPLELSFVTPTGTVSVGNLAPLSFYVDSTTAEIQVTVPLGTDEPDLFYDEALQLPFTSATLLQRNSAGNVVAQWTLAGDVLVHAYSYDAPVGGIGVATETVTLKGTQITLGVNPPLPGTANGAVFDTYNYSTKSDSLLGTPTSSTTGNDTASGLIVVNVTSGSTIVLNGLNEYLRLDVDGTTLDIYNGTAAIGLPTQYLLSNYSSIQVTPAFAGIGLLTVDESLGNPLPSGGLNLNGSIANVSESLLIKGFSGTNPITVNTSTITALGSIISYAGISGITVDGSTGNTTLTQSAQPGESATLSFINTTSADSITLNAGTFTIPASTSGIGVYRLNNLTATAGTTIKIAGPSSVSTRSVLVVNKSNLLGTLDLGGNDFDVRGSVSQFTSAVATGFNGGNWSGVGITSSLAAADPTHLTALGVVSNTVGATTLFNASHPFDGTTPGANDILVKYTYFGDANIDGKVDGSDYTLIDNGYNNHLTGWYNGDFNYDGKVDGSDYTLIDNAFNTQGASLAAVVASPTATATVNANRSSPAVTSQNTSAADSNDWFSSKRKKPNDSFFA